MASRRLEDMTPELQGRYLLFEEKMRAAGLPFMVTCTARTVREQVALHAQGREDLVSVNSLRKRAGLPPITAKENNNPVTWTLASEHIIDLDDGILENDKSRAFDIAITRGKVPDWTLKVDVNQNRIPDYMEAGKIGESCGLEWGGRWKRRDYAHFQLPKGERR